MSTRSKGVTDGFHMEMFMKRVKNDIFRPLYSYSPPLFQVALTDSGGSYEAGLSTVQAVRQVVVRVTYRLTAWMGIGHMSMFTCRGCHTWPRRTCLHLTLCPAPSLRTSQHKNQIGRITRKYFDNNCYI